MNTVYEKRVAEIEKVRKESLGEITRNYGNALEQLEKQFMRAGDLDGAVAIRNRRAALLGLAPVSETPSTAGWEAIRTRTKYSYLNENAPARSDGDYDYSDPALTKLMDGIVARTIDGKSVGWSHSTPSPIYIRLPSPVRPSALRLHLFDQRIHSAVGLPKRIAVYEASALRAAKEKKVAEVTDIAPSNGWVTVPLTMSFPNDRFILEIERSDRQWILVDEIEFSL